MIVEQTREVDLDGLITYRQVHDDGIVVVAVFGEGETKPRVVTTTSPEGTELVRAGGITAVALPAGDSLLSRDAADVVRRLADAAIEAAP